MGDGQDQVQDEAKDQERAYRRALGGFATGVCVISVAEADNRYAAITVNSFTSVSLSPRLILWCLGCQSDRFAAFAHAERFGVTVLRADQMALAARLAQTGAKALAADEVEAWPEAPVLSAGTVRFACATHERRQVGDHLVIVGEVLRYATAPGEALTYFAGQYGKASP